MIAWLARHRAALLLALRRLAATPLNTLLSLAAIGIVLALPAIGLMMLSNLPAARQVSAAPRISLYLAVEADRQAAREVEARLARMANVRSLKFVPREETLERMKSGHGLAEVIEALPGNPFPDAFVVVPADENPAALEALAAEFARLPRVEHVQLDSAWARRLDALWRLGRAAVAMLAMLLGVGLVSVSFATIRLQVMTCRPEIELSRLLGATEAFIRGPFLWFGTLQGLLGGAVAWLVALAATLWLRGPIGVLAGQYGLRLDLAPLPPAESALLLLVAATLGWVGAALSLRQA